MINSNDQKPSIKEISIGTEIYNLRDKGAFCTIDKNTNDGSFTFKTKDNDGNQRISSFELRGEVPKNGALFKWVNGSFELLPYPTKSSQVLFAAISTTTEILYFDGSNYYNAQKQTVVRSQASTFASQVEIGQDVRQLGNEFYAPSNGQWYKVLGFTPGGLNLDSTVIDQNTHTSLVPIPGKTFYAQTYNTIANLDYYWDEPIKVYNSYTALNQDLANIPEGRFVAV